MVQCGISNISLVNCMIMIKFGVVVVIFVGYCAELLMNLLFFVFFFSMREKKFCGVVMQCGLHVKEKKRE